MKRNIPCNYNIIILKILNLSFMLNIVIPNEHIVLEYEKLLRKIRDRILQDNDETARLIELRDWLLPMLMNGQATIDD